MVNQLPRRGFQPRQWWILLLLLLASIHCGRSIFFDNTSFVDLTKYENGTAAMPFQGRVAMMPVLRWAHSNAALQKMTESSLERHGEAHLLTEPASPEKTVSEIVGVVSLILLMGFSAWYGNLRIPEFWWLPAALTLVQFYVTYAARYEQDLWYPYDLPHFLLFTLACFAILERRWLILLVLFCLDAPMRETAVYLIPCVLVSGFETRRWRPVVLVSAAMAVVWAAIRVMIRRRFLHNPSDTSIHYHQAYHALVGPQHWPQVASAFGFLALPLWLGRKLLPRNQYLLLMAALPCVAFSGLFGIWYETRMWDEWVGVAALLLAVEAAALWGRSGAEVPAVVVEQL